MRSSVSIPNLGTRLVAVCALLAACSMQDFGYLQNDGSSAGAAGSSSAGSGATEGGTKMNGVAGDDSDVATSGSQSGGKGGGGGSDPGGPSEAGEPGLGGASGAEAGGAGSDGTGATGELLNPSFETHSTVGWTVQPPDALTQRFIFVQGAQGTATVQDGTYELGTWHDKSSFQLEIFQKVKGLADGTYTFKGYFTVGPNYKSLKMFARNCGGAALAPLPLSSTAVDEWLPVELTGIEVVGGSCEVGLSIESNPGNWMNADLFSLQKMDTTKQ